MLAFMQLLCAGTTTLFGGDRCPGLARLGHPAHSSRQGPCAPAVIGRARDGLQQGAFWREGEGKRKMLACDGPRTNALDGRFNEGGYALSEPVLRVHRM